MQAEALNELLRQEVQVGLYPADLIPQRLIQILLNQTDELTPTDAQNSPHHWLGMIQTIKARGFTQEDLKQILGLDNPDLKYISNRIEDPLKSRSSSLHGRIHTARIIVSKIRSKQKVAPAVRFLTFPVTDKGSLFNFVQAGSFVLNQAEAQSQFWYRAAEFQQTADDISLSLFQADFPFGQALAEYSQSFHQNVLGPIGISNCRA